ncbi:MAG TPA: hypothetical protein VM869_03155 [Enhygromyxa sp.]|nr:hypothetical protein [Enhygromyxa sp.]
MANHDVDQFLSRLAVPTLALALSALSGCVMWMREPEFYGEELTELLEAHAEPIEACYDRYLSEQDATAKGTVAVNFQVEKRTGVITDVEVDAQHSTAPEALASCVTDELAQTKLEPVDAKTAQASFTWEFVRGSQKRPPVDPFASVQETLLGCYATHLAEVDRAAQGDVVIDYAFDRKSGAIERLEVIAEGTTAPAPVVECASEVLSSARLDPAKLEDRNAAGRRSFALRYVPQVASN